MIFALIAAASASAVPAPQSANGGQLVASAEHALRSNRLDEATLMIRRAVGAGVSGPALERVLADLDFASRRYAEAFAAYEALLKVAPDDESLLEPAGIAALKLGDVSRAASLLARATSATGASWRAWNAGGVVADLQSDWATADACYDRATRLAPAEAGPVNNRGWSLLLRGNWKEALGFFEHAAVMDPASPRIANNLELARTALAAKLPERRAGESDSAWAARLNDAGVAAALLGERELATAAFTEALDASGAWYARAANNLGALGSR